MNGLCSQQNPALACFGRLIVSCTAPFLQHYAVPLPAHAQPSPLPLLLWILSCCVVLITSSVQLAAANLLGMMADQSSPMQTYFASLPTKEELLSPLVSMPEEYLPLLQSDLAVSGSSNIEVAARLLHSAVG